MDVSQIRNSFLIFVADSDIQRGSEKVRLLSDLGYQCEHRVNVDSLSEEVVRNPPHMIFFQYGDLAFFPDNRNKYELLTRIQKQLPETHIFFFCSVEEKKQADQLFQFGIYDLIAWPSDFSHELLKAADRAAISDYYMYKTEQFDGNVSDHHSPTSSDFAFLEIYMKELESTHDRDALIRHTIQELARRFKSEQSVYMRYLPGVGTLAMAHVFGVDEKSVSSVGIDLRKQEPGFMEEMLLHPMQMRSLRQFIKSGLLRKDFVAFPHVEKNIIRGLFIVLSDLDAVFREDANDDPYVKICLTLLKKSLDNHDLRSRYERLSVYDEESEAFKTNYTLQKIKEEISRARRLTKPTGFLLISIDGLAELRLEQTKSAMERMLQSFVQILATNSRLNDLVGRLNENQFCIVLPHTDKRGAVVKAERIRRMIESADFSNVLAARSKLTVSIGVSEYPSICHDIDGLLRSSEEALNEVLRVGTNRVCLAAPPTHFIPDFEISDGKTV